MRLCAPQSGRRNQEASWSTALENSMWNVSSRDCVMSDECISSPNFPGSYDLGGSCRIDITSVWTGFLHVECLYLGSWLGFEDVFLVDDVSYYRTYSLQVSPLHGSVPRNSIVWSEGTIVFLNCGWRICEVDSMPPFLFRPQRTHIQLLHRV